MGVESVASVASAIAALAAAFVAWAQLSRAEEERHAKRAAARKAAAPAVVRVCQVIDSVLAFEQPLARARQFLARREELWSFYTLLGPVNADLSERDAMASTRAGILLESADQILSSYAVNQDWDGEVDRLHHAPNDLVAAREELESLLEPCLRQMRRELRARRGVIEEWAEAVARDMVRESGNAAE